MFPSATCISLTHRHTHAGPSGGIGDSTYLPPNIDEVLKVESLLGEFNPWVAEI